MNLLRDEKFKDLLNFRRTFEEKVLELSSVVNRFRSGRDIPGAVRLSYGFLNALRTYLNARRDLGSRKIALDHLAKLGENGERAGDNRFQSELQGFREAYHAVEDEFVNSNNALTENIQSMLGVLGSGRVDDSQPTEREAFVNALDHLLEGENGRYPRFSDDPADNQQANQEVERLRRRIESLDEELSAVKDQRAALQDAVHVAIEKERELDVVREEAAQLRSEVEELREGNGGVPAEELRALRQRAEDVRRLEEELSRVSVERDALRDAVDRGAQTRSDAGAQQAVEQLDTRVRALEEEIGALRSERDTLLETANRTEHLQTEIGALLQEREQLMDRLTDRENAAFAGVPARRAGESPDIVDFSDELSALEDMAELGNEGGVSTDLSDELSALEDMAGLLGVEGTSDHDANSS